VANYMHAYTLYSAVRPFGATIILGSWDKQVRFLLPFGQQWGVGEVDF